MPKALLLENIHPDAAQSLRDHGFGVECLKGALNEDELIDAPKTVSFIPSQNRPTHPWIMPNTLEAADYRPDRFIFSLRSANSRIKSAVPSIPSTEESMQRW